MIGDLIAILRFGSFLFKLKESLKALLSKKGNIRKMQLNYTQDSAAVQM